jgi:hypothetical protein
VCPGGIDSESVKRPELSWRSFEVDARDSLAEPRRAPVDDAAETLRSGSSPALDPLKRLDALARLLDERLKAPQEGRSDSAAGNSKAGEPAG